MGFLIVNAHSGLSRKRRHVANGHPMRFVEVARFRPVVDRCLGSVLDSIRPRSQQSLTVHLTPFLSLVKSLIATAYPCCLAKRLIALIPVSAVSYCVSVGGGGIEVVIGGDGIVIGGDGIVIGGDGMEIDADDMTNHRKLVSMEEQNKQSYLPARA